MYAPNYMANPYAAAPYYMPQPYQNAAMPGPPAYMPYPHAGYGRSPPAVQHYVPMHQNFGRHPQHSPIVSSPYHPPPPVAAPVEPSSLPCRLRCTNNPSRSPSRKQNLNQRSNPSRLLSRQLRLLNLRLLHPGHPSGHRSPGSPTPIPHSPKAEKEKEGAEVPAETPAKAVVEKKEPQPSVETERVPLATPKVEPKAETISPRSETFSTQAQPSEGTASTSPTTPASTHQSKASVASSTPASSAKLPSRPAAPAVPVVPLVPALPKAAPKEAKPAVEAETASSDTESTADVPSSQQTEPSQPSAEGENVPAETKAPEAAQPTPAPARPKLWAGLFSKPAAAAPTTSSAVTAAEPQTNGNAADTSASVPSAGSFAKANASSLAEALHAYRATAPDKLAFLEPRGLVNTGNMCYMNSVLQVLIYCIPFYSFLDQVSKKAAHSFKSETPLVDAMIMFMREYKLLDSAPTAEQLKKRLKSEDYEKYGEAFTPEFVYEAIRTLPRFASMRRGHQQDAQEFLGFLLEGLHDESTHVMRAAPASTASTAPSSSLPSPTFSTADAADDWLEVGPRQRSAVTRSSGHSATLSPINKIFGGQLRSELRVPGNKNSVTLEPYQPLQLDIGSPEIRNIIDALKGLTRPEIIHGDFNSPHGKDVRATKQVFIESVPPVLILHLKRFQFDAEGYGGTVKIWKKVGYPLEFDFPREVLSRQKRNSIITENSNGPRYRLIGVVYHHGKNASGGHYTVDVRRQDGREWIRIDDTVIRRVRDEDVAEGGAEEEAPKAGERRDAAVSGLGNRFAGINDEDAGDDDGWKQAAGGKKWSTVVNGATPATNGQKAAKHMHKESMKENKVAYLLFYQRI
ncbi:hypothetical protein N0V88_002521 [Collariella sp. IMI 366227]|nr:hypothetical protein N0V88_002521 [Collariella sp. IMI 366227]